MSARQPGVLPVENKLTFSDMPLISKVIAVVGGIGVVFLVGTFELERRLETSRASLPGQCIDLAPVKQAQIKGIVRYDRSRMAEVIQTDNAGNNSVVFVPLSLAEERLKPCN